MAQARRVFKTKQKLTSSGGPLIFRKWGQYSEGDEIIGKFVGTHYDQKYKGTHWILEVEDAHLADRPFAKEIIGKRLVLNKAGKLDKAMKEVEEGEMVRVVYNGKLEMESGPYVGTEAHQHDVETVMGEGEEDDSVDFEESETGRKYNGENDDDDEDDAL